MNRRANPLYAMNDGKLAVHDKKSGTSAGGKPTETLAFWREFWFENIGMYSDEYYAAKQAETVIEKRVRILRCDQINNKKVIVIEGKQYEVGRVCPGENKAGVPVTDITLERTEKKYDFD